VDEGDRHREDPEAVSFQLQLHTDQLAPKSELRLPAGNRVIYVREGDAVVRAGGQVAGLAANSAWHGSREAGITAGNEGATLWRWDLAPGDRAAKQPAVPGVTTTLALAHHVELADPGGYLVRCDRVNFPPGGIAWTHVHRGPGIRRLLEGTLRVEVNGAGHDIAPGEAWFEAGPDPVLATASKTVPSAFARVMILPREMLGKPSVRYIRPEDADKPKLQTYRVFVDDPIQLP
jgi:quercetin dioxygenase-like cupin family protein